MTRHCVSLTRDVRLVLCCPDGEVYGALPRFAVDTPWWMEVANVIDGARDRFGVAVTIVRLLETEDRWPPHGGAVTYLAETVDRVPVEPCAIVLDDHPARLPWARPGGVTELVEWADQFVQRTGPARQLRTWNLSCVVQLPTTNGPAWLKAVPPFMAHEGAVIESVGALGPPLIARGDAVVLMADVPGEDQYDAPADVCAAMVRRWVQTQATWSGHVDGLPNWQPASFIEQLRPLAGQPELELLLSELPARFDALYECGLPDTLVHGDFHPGNWRGDTLLDWGDSGFGHPLFDQPAFLHAHLMTEDKRAAVRAAWRDGCRDAWPASDPDRAARLIEPIAALRQARIYRTFIENIEPSEHCYHRHDTAEWIARAIERSLAIPLPRS